MYANFPRNTGNYFIRCAAAHNRIRMEHFVYLVMSTFAGAFLSPMSWLIAVVVGMFFDNLIVIVLLCILLRGGLWWVLWLTSASIAEDVNESVLVAMGFLIPQVAAILVIALIARAVREVVMRKPLQPSSDRRVRNR